MGSGNALSKSCPWMGPRFCKDSCFKSNKSHETIEKIKLLSYNIHIILGFYFYFWKKIQSWVGTSVDRAVFSRKWAQMCWKNYILLEYLMHAIAYAFYYTDFIFICQWYVVHLTFQVWEERWVRHISWTNPLPNFFKKSTVKKTR